MKKCKFLKFIFELQNKESLILTYELHENSLRERYISHLRKRQKQLGLNYNLKIANKTRKDIEYLMNKLNFYVSEINKFYDRQLPIFTSTTEIDRNILNYLHEEFEEYGERHQNLIVDQKYHLKVINGDPNVWPGTKFNKQFHEYWMSLNEWIHVTEIAMNTDEEEFPNFSCLVHAYPPVPGEPLVQMDKLFLQSNYKWGRLYLGYNTLGKDYLHTCHDNDVRVIINNQIKIQKLFSSEIWLNFSADSVENFSQLEFYKWFMNLDEEVKKLIPIDNLNELAFGRYLMGQVVIDSTFLNFHNNFDDWKIDANLQKKWNLEVFSKIENIIDVEIVE